jgi:hypothetical protein
VGQDLSEIQVSLWHSRGLTVTDSTEDLIMPMVRLTLIVSTGYNFAGVVSGSVLSSILKWSDHATIDYLGSEIEASPSVLMNLPLRQTLAILIERGFSTAEIDGRTPQPEERRTMINQVSLW